MVATDLYPKLTSINFTIRNISPQRKRLTIFNTPIEYLQTYDLMTIEGIAEDDIRSSLVKGELANKIRVGAIQIVSSSINLLQFDAEQKAFIDSANADVGQPLPGTDPITQCGSGGNSDTFVYRALLTKVAASSGTVIDDFNQGLIIGETYEITDFQAGDDFSNIANVQSGTINQTGCVFIATAEVPANWSNMSELTSSGNLAVTVLENNLGFDIVWQNIFTGVYVGINATTGPIYNSFSRNNVSVNVSNSIPFFLPPTQFIANYGFTAGLGVKDEVIAIVSFEWDSLSNIDDNLYYTPVEVRIKKDLNTNPITVTGTIVDTFPFNYASVDLFAGNNNVETFYTDSNQVVNNISELVTLLNNNSTTSYLGTFADDGIGGITLTIATNLKNQFSLNNVLTFEVFED